MSTDDYKHLSLREKARYYSRLMDEPGWKLLKQSFRPDIRSRITDTDAKEEFLYEAIRCQVLQELFATPRQVIRQAEKTVGFLPPHESKKGYLPSYPPKHTQDNSSHSYDA